MNDAKQHRWEDIPADEPLPGVSRQRLIGEQAMLSRFELAAGCEVPAHEHENEQFACVLSGQVRFVVGSGADQRDVIVGPGEVLHVPAMVRHAAFPIKDSVVLDVFAPPSATTGVDK